MHIILLRHAESERNKLIHDGKADQLHTMPGKNPLLTDKGKKQAQHCGPVLRNLFEVKENVEVWCSTLDRTAQTLKEAGIESMVYKEILNEWDKHTETWEKFSVRVDKFLIQLWQLYETNTVQRLVIAGHSLFFSLLISKIFGSNTLIAEFPNTSLSSLHIKDGKFAVYTLGDVEHLPKDLRTGVWKPW
jgi:broad specificity phosphatase PhoE